MSIQCCSLQKDGEFNLEFITERDRVDEAKVILYNLNDLNLNLYVGGVRSASTWRQNELPNKKNRNPDQVWALFWREPPSKCRIEQHQLAWLDGIFNWTISYRRDSDVNYPFGYLKQVEHIKNLGAKWSTYLTKRMGVAWHSDTCDTVGRSILFALELSVTLNDTSVPAVPPPTCISAGGEEVALALADDGNHIYGSCINRTVRLPLGTTGEAALSSRARFYVAFEEEICDDYITERYFRALHHGYVPLVLGGADVGYDEVALAGTYIDAIDFVTEEGPLGLRRHLAELPWLEFSQYLLWQLDYTVDSCQGQWRLRLGEKVVADMARQKKSILDFSQFWHSKKCYGRYNTAKFH